MADGAVVTGRWELRVFLADRPVTAHTALGPTGQRAVLFTQVKSRLRPDTDY